MLLAVIFRFGGILTHRRDWDFPHTTSSASTRLSTALQDYVDWTIKPRFWRNSATKMPSLKNEEMKESGSTRMNRISRIQRHRRKTVPITTLPNSTHAASAKKICGTIRSPESTGAKNTSCCRFVSHKVANRK